MIDELDMNKGGSGWNIIFDGTSNSPPCTISFFVWNPQNVIFTNLDGKVLATIQWALVCNGSYTFFFFQNRWTEHNFSWKIVKCSCGYVANPSGTIPDTLGRHSIFSQKKVHFGWCTFGQNIHFFQTCKAQKHEFNFYKLKKLKNMNPIFLS